MGVQLPNLATSAEVMEHAGLDYTVTKQLLYTLADKKRLVEIPDQFCTIRTDTTAVLGVVGSRYTVLQNTDAFRFFDALVGDGDAIYETAGALGRGERIWLLAKLPSYIRIGKNDIVNKYLLLTNAHDGSSVVRCKLIFDSLCSRRFFSPRTRVRCPERGGSVWGLTIPHIGS